MNANKVSQFFFARSRYSSLDGSKVAPLARPIVISPHGPLAKEPVQGCIMSERYECHILHVLHFRVDLSYILQSQARTSSLRAATYSALRLLLKPSVGMSK